MEVYSKRKHTNKILVVKQNLSRLPKIRIIVHVFIMRCIISCIFRQQYVHLNNHKVVSVRVVDMFLFSYYSNIRIYFIYERRDSFVSIKIELVLFVSRPILLSFLNFLPFLQTEILFKTSSSVINRSI